MTVTKTKRVEDINKILDFIEHSTAPRKGNKPELDEAFYKQQWEDQFTRLMTAGYLTYLVEDTGDSPLECLKKIMLTELRVNYYNLVNYLLAVEESLELYTYDLSDEFGGDVMMDLYQVTYQGLNKGEFFDDKKMEEWLAMSGSKLRKRRTRKPKTKITTPKKDATKCSNEDGTVKNS